MPHFNLVAHMDFEAVARFVKLNKLHLTSVVVYLICKAVNSIPEMRQRIRGEHVVEHEIVHPSFTVPTEDSDVFSFCYVDYTQDFQDFSKAVYASMQSRKGAPSLTDEADRDDFLFLSAMPWVHFTGLSHAMRIEKGDSVPRIVWGKMGGVGGFLLPLGLQAHHALVDGRHAGQFYNSFQELCNDPVAAMAFKSSPRSDTPV